MGRLIGVARYLDLKTQKQGLMQVGLSTVSSVLKITIERNLTKFIKNALPFVSAENYTIALKNKKKTI